MSIQYQSEMNLKEQQDDRRKDIIYQTYNCHEPYVKGQNYYDWDDFSTNPEHQKSLPYYKTFVTLSVIAPSRADNTAIINLIHLDHLEGSGFSFFNFINFSCKIIVNWNSFNFK